jgi:hypothetical protein
MLTWNYTEYGRNKKNVRAVTVAQKTRERLDVSGYLLAGKKTGP